MNVPMLVLTIGADAYNQCAFATYMISNFILLICLTSTTLNIYAVDVICVDGNGPSCILQTIFKP